MLPYLEEIYTQYSKSFQYQPSRPFLIEIFSSHEKFSGRITSLPDLHTVGACTGRVMAMASPYAEGVGKPFNWVRVLRHELVHMFNLDQTHFLVPHWLTEGLAVSFEGFPRPARWNQLLLERVPAGDLMTLDTIDQGFIRPRSALDWHMAYCQSQLYVQFLRERFGSNAAGDMLAAFRDGMNVAAALQKVCHQSQDAFESGYQVYVRNVVAGLQPHAPVKKPSFMELQKEHDADPNDPEVAALLAEQYLVRQDRLQARRLAEGALSKDPVPALARYVKAKLLLDAGDDEQARSLLEQAVDPRHPEPKVLQLLGKIYYESREFKKAAEMFELGNKSQPYENHWLMELSRALGAAGEMKRQVEVLERLVRTDADEYQQRKRLAQMLLGARRFPEAEKYAREALEVDVRDAEARDMLEQALLAQNKKDAAAELRKVLMD
jgi:tetratricopeptide (TPR) repeat protein